MKISVEVEITDFDDYYEISDRIKERLHFILGQVCGAVQFGGGVFAEGKATFSFSLGTLGSAKLIGEK